MLPPKMERIRKKENFPPSPESEIPVEKFESFQPENRSGPVWRSSRSGSMKVEGFIPAGEANQNPSLVQPERSEHDQKKFKEFEKIAGPALAGKSLQEVEDMFRRYKVKQSESYLREQIAKFKKGQPVKPADENIPVDSRREADEARFRGAARQLGITTEKEIQEFIARQTETEKNSMTKERNENFEEEFEEKKAA